jgi:hypothetical protein
MLKIAVLATFVVIGLAGWATVSTGNAHWVQRGGAALAAIAAGLAILEAFVERELHEAQATKPEDPDPFGAVPRTIVRRVQQGRWRLQNRHLSHDKLLAVIFISSIAISGELIHGFGDIAAIELGKLFRIELSSHET